MYIYAYSSITTIIYFFFSIVCVCVCMCMWVCICICVLVVHELWSEWHRDIKTKRERIFLLLLLWKWVNQINPPTSITLIPLLIFYICSVTEMKGFLIFNCCWLNKFISFNNLKIIIIIIIVNRIQNSFSVDLILM